MLSSYFDIQYFGCIEKWKSLTTIFCTPERLQLTIIYKPGRQKVASGMENS